MWRILLADDHGLYRKGLSVALQRAFPDAVLMMADTFDGALGIIEQRNDLDLVVIDLHMPHRLSSDTLRDLSRGYRNLHIVALSASESPADILECLACGCHGYISKLQSDDEIVAGIADVLNGKIYVTSRLALGTEAALSLDALRRPELSDAQMTRLTPRQQEVLPLLAQGKSNKEIARELDIAEATVKIHAAAVVRALGARNRASAALFAQNWLMRHR